MCDGELRTECLAFEVRFQDRLRELCVARSVQQNVHKGTASPILTTDTCSCLQCRRPTWTMALWHAHHQPITGAVVEQRSGRRHADRGGTSVSSAVSGALGDGMLLADA
jgi:hypothetical protein